MSSPILDLFSFSDRAQMASLNHRQRRAEVIHGNVANAETPGFRALQYDFESQLQALVGSNEPIPLITSEASHLKHEGVSADGSIEAKVGMRPTESVGNDGNTVDIDLEMAQLAQNQILYRATIETINRKVGILKYAINGGR